jgi:hypothetical protein
VWGDITTKPGRERGQVKGGRRDDEGGNGKDCKRQPPVIFHVPSCYLQAPTWAHNGQTTDTKTPKGGMQRFWGHQVMAGGSMPLTLDQEQRLSRICTG